MTCNEQPQNLGTKIDALKKLKDERTALNAQVSKLGEQIEELEADIIDMMDEQGTTQSRSKLATASISEQSITVVDDWDELLNYIHHNEAYYLLQRRVSNKPFAELAQTGEQVPGTHLFTKRTIALRTL